MSVIYINRTFIRDWRGITATPAQVIVERDLGRNSVKDFTGNVLASNAALEQVFGHVISAGQPLIDVEFTYAVALVQTVCDALLRAARATGVMGIKVECSPVDRGTWSERGREPHGACAQVILGVVSTRGEGKDLQNTITSIRADLSGNWTTTRETRDATGVPVELDQNEGRLWVDPANHALARGSLLGDFASLLAGKLKWLCAEGLDS